MKKQYGWNLHYGTGHNGVKLVSIKTISPSWIKNQHLDKITNWSELKKTYNNKCATCGAKEGEQHPKDKTIKVKLEKGHMNTEMNSGPKVQHKGPIRIEVTLTNKQKNKILRDYLVALVANLPISNPKW